MPKEEGHTNTDPPPTTLIQEQKNRDMIQAKIIIEGEQTEEEKMKAKTILTKEHTGRKTIMKKISEQKHPEERLIQIIIQKGTLKIIPGITHPEKKPIQTTLQKEKMNIISVKHSQKRRQFRPS